LRRKPFTIDDEPASRSPLRTVSSFTKASLLIALISTVGEAIAILGDGALGPYVIGNAILSSMALFSGLGLIMGVIGACHQPADLLAPFAAVANLILMMMVPAFLRAGS
jgi:hypothetical protein